MKKNPKYVAITENFQGITRHLEFNEASHEDMSKDEVERYIKAAFPDLKIKDIR